MAKHITGYKFSHAWQSLLRELLVEGKLVSPRGSNTKEITNVTFEVTDGLSNILVNAERGLNYRFLIAEWLWIQAGLNDVNILAKYNSVMKQFSDDGLILSGAYGPRLMPQIPYILHNLGKEGTRQAVATIWTPSPQDSKDIPCTISLQWVIREGKLHATVNMRSSDVWLGLPYDYFTFSQLTNYIASCLDVLVGSVTMNLASSHLYEQHWNSAAKAAYTMFNSTIRSPLIPVDQPMPESDQIKAMLLQESVGLTSFWKKYEEALAHDKTLALEVLRGISPVKELI